MPPQFDALIYAASIWVIPLIIAITFHEAAHGYVARFSVIILLGSSVASRSIRSSTLTQLGLFCCQPYCF
jgi:hypothetical protein